jgi:phosphoserine phosphatase RsbU/P
MKSIVPFKISSEQTIIDVFETSLLKLQKQKPKIVFSNRLSNDLKIAFIEAIANAIRHADELKQTGSIEGRFVLDDHVVAFEVYDHGNGFDVDSVPVPDLNDLKASGRGVFMMKQLGEVVSYKKKKKHNVLTFKRNLVAHHATAKELDLLYELSEAIIGNASEKEVYQIILKEALDLFHVERASVLIYDEKIKSLRMIASSGISKEVQKETLVRAGEGVSGYVFQHARPLLIEDIDSNTRGIEKKEHYKTKSFISAPMICSPLRLDEKPIGVINLTDRIDGKKFTKQDLKVLSTIANHAMACLYIRGLVKEIKEKERLAQEMEQVRLIQSSYLPKKAPQIEGYQLAGRCEMAQSVGGDYFDFFYLEHYLFVVVADVSGHNTRSAVTMVNFRSQLKAYLNVVKDPAHVLTYLNRSLYTDLTNAEQFVSCLLVRIDLKDHSYEISNAGHYPPIFLKDHVPALNSGLVLGVERNEVYENIQGSLIDQDGMILFTDGVIESVGSDGGVFGFDRLQDITHEEKNKSSHDVVNHIITDVLSYRTTDVILDDVTVVAIKRD